MKYNFQTSKACMLIEFKKWSFSPRVAIIFLSVFFILHSEMLPLRNFCASVNHGANPLAFPQIFTSSYYITTFTFLATLLFANAPFLDASAPYELIRSKRSSWYFGKIAYIILSSFLYVSAIVLSSIILMIPYVTFEPGWGKVFYTLARGGIPFEDYQIYFLVPALIQTTPAWYAFSFYFFILLLQVIIIGLIIQVINLYVENSLLPGITVACIYSSIPLGARFQDPDFVYYFPPMWTSLGNLSPVRATSPVSTRMAFVYLLLIAFTLIILGFLQVRKTTINVYSEI